MKLQSAKSKVHLSLDIWTSTTESSPCTSACGEPFREEQFVTLLPILRDFVSTYLKEEGVKWDPEVHRLRCLGHVINLAVQAFLFQNSIDLKEGEICEDADDLAKFKGSAPNFAALDHLVSSTTWLSTSGVHQDAVESLWNSLRGHST
ncbi:hypothetical protein HRG_014313 [Hirsutella rhossiliensis]